ncbi:MAG TPA: thioredoxin domain-containing protein [Solirubrobacterales bacterium]|nr:thioredoxin domain-containing protein [Solirubrobacterales bacterium]
MSIPVNEETFDQEVLERSYDVPVVVDFWADWCGPCKTLSPALEKAEAARGGRVILAKVDVEADPRLAALFKVQGIPAVKAFRDGKVVDEFVGALPPARVEAFFDSLLPSRADELLAAGDELSLREAAELEPRRTDVAVALAKARLERGAQDEALEAVSGHEGDFAAEGIAARVRLAKAGICVEAFESLDQGDPDAALDALLAELEGAPSGGEATQNGDLTPAELRDLLRRAIVGILSEADPADPASRAYRRRLAAALD